MYVGPVASTDKLLKQNRLREWIWLGFGSGLLTPPPPFFSSIRSVFVKLDYSWGKASSAARQAVNCGCGFGLGEVLQVWASGLCQSTTTVQKHRRRKRELQKTSGCRFSFEPLTPFSTYWTGYWWALLYNCNISSEWTPRGPSHFLYGDPTSISR